MIPLRDRQRASKRPVLTYTLIALNVFVFAAGLMMTRAESEAFVWRFGVVPDLLVRGEHVGSFVTPLTSMFLHGGWLHILSNMWFLHIFGDNVEDNLGRARFLVFYVLCGLVAVVAQVVIDPTSQVPMVGASGAIAGVLAAYVRLYPRARILTLIPIFIFIQFAEVPAVFFIVVWFGLQLVGGLQSLQQIGSGMGGVAFFAHLGGFIAGLVLVQVLKRKRHTTEGWRPPPTPWDPRGPQSFRR